MRSALLSAVLSVALLLAAPHLRADDAPAAAVVHFSKLTPFLADVAGWEAGKAQGNTLDAGTVKLSNAERRYTKGESRVEVTIVDYNQSPEMLKGLTLVWGFSNESSEGFQKSVTLDGQKGFETYQNEGKHAEVFLLVGGRFMVSVKSQGLEPAETEAWAKKLDLKKLAELK